MTSMQPGLDLPQSFGFPTRCENMRGGALPSSVVEAPSEGFRARARAPEGAPGPTQQAQTLASSTGGQQNGHSSERQSAPPMPRPAGETRQGGHILLTQTAADNEDMTPDQVLHFAHCAAMFTADVITWCWLAVSFLKELLRCPVRACTSYCDVSTGHGSVRCQNPCARPCVHRACLGHSCALHGGPSAGTEFMEVPLQRALWWITRVHRAGMNIWRASRAMLSTWIVARVLGMTYLAIMAILLLVRWRGQGVDDGQQLYNRYEGHRNMVDYAQ